MGRFLRRLFRLAFHAAAGFSALAFVACVILWPRSYYRVDTAARWAPRLPGRAGDVRA